MRSPVAGAVRAQLPHYRDLTTAFRRPVQPTDGQFLRWARMLAVLHRVRATYPGSGRIFDATRDDLRANLAGWITEHTAASPRAAAECAIVVDQMAAAHVAAAWLLRPGQPGTKEELHDAWSEVGYIATHWEDLVAQVTMGQRPVPRRVVE